MKNIQFFIFLLFSACLFGKTVHVNNQTGSDSNDGLSLQTAKKSIASATALLYPGDVLSLTAGQTYFESLTFPRDGTPTQPITVEGNGAFISGIMIVPADKWQDQGDDLYFQPATIKRGALAPYLVNKELVPLPRGKSPKTMLPGQGLCNTDGMYVRCQPGQTPADLGLQVTARASGVTLNNRSYITVRNLTAEYFSNDGYNIHGYCRGLVFENITGRHNGDDGFSIHEDVAALVRGGHFHHNNYGIQDVTASRSWYQGVLVEENRLIGVHFVGGARSLEDSIVRNNHTGQIKTQSDRAKGLGYEPGNPMERGMFFFKNVVVEATDSTVAFQAAGQSRNVISNCSFLGGSTGVIVQEQAELHMHASLVAGCQNRELQIAAKSIYVASANAYHPGRLQFGEQIFDAGQLAAFQDATGQERDSVIAAPERGSSGRLVGPRVIFVGKGIAAGPDTSAYLPDKPLVADQPTQTFAGPPPVLGSAQTTTAAPQPTAFPWPSPDADGWVKFDFEATNPWNLIYPEPANMANGQPLAGTAELSNEQAVSGKHSMRLQVPLPANDREQWLIKLFSQRLGDGKGKIRRVRFQLYGDGSNIVLAPRFRDRGGETHQGKSLRLDWQGWRELEWDLQQSPPAIRGGDKNQTLDAPFQFVVDFRVPVPADGKVFTIYIDDLSFQLEKP